MAQGLKIATSWFIGILNQIYAKINEWVVNYLDDSVLGSDDNEDQHFARVVEFIKITNDAGLRVSLPKSVFFAKDLCFLNYSLTNGAWSLSDNQRKTINSLNSDNMTKQKRESLAAFINHFNRFHTGVSYAARKIRDPSTSAEAIKSILDNIKKSLIESPALKSVNFKDPLYIYTDASKFDCAGVITQRGKNGVQLVTCFSKKFPEAVVNKPVHERELWALQQLCHTYKYLLIGRHKKVFFNDNKIVLAAEKSRAPSLRCLFDTIKSSFSNVEFKFVSTDKNASDCFTRINNMESSSDSEELNPEVVISENLKSKIMKIHVNAGCCAPKRVVSTFQGMGLRVNSKEIEEILKNCTICNSIENFHRPRRSAPGITIPKEATSQCCIYIDHKTIMSKSRVLEIRENSADPDYSPESEYSSCLTVFEPVSSVVWVHPVKDYSSDSVKKALRIFFMINGPSKNVVADNAASFTALKGWLKKNFDSDLHHTSVYHPSSNLSERAHREFEKALKKYNQSSQEYNYLEWEDTLANACIAMNSLRHDQWKVSPYEIFKNRIQCDVEPVRFYPVGMERKLVNEKFVEKVRNILKSKLKIVLPVYRKGETVKVEIPGELSRFGVVTSTKDHWAKSTVTVKFENQKPVGVHKNNICVPRNAQSAPESDPASFNNPTSSEIIPEPNILSSPVAEPVQATSVPVSSSNPDVVSARTRSRVNV